MRAQQRPEPAIWTPPRHRRALGGPSVRRCHRPSAGWPGSAAASSHHPGPRSRRTVSPRRPAPPRPPPGAPTDPLGRAWALAQAPDRVGDREHRTERAGQADQPGRRDLEPHGIDGEGGDVEHPGDDHQAYRHAVGRCGRLGQHLQPPRPQPPDDHEEDQGRGRVGKPRAQHHRQPAVVLDGPGQRHRQRREQQHRHDGDRDPRSDQPRAPHRPAVEHDRRQDDAGGRQHGPDDLGGCSVSPRSSTARTTVVPPYATMTGLTTLSGPIRSAVK